MRSEGGIETSRTRRRTPTYGVTDLKDLVALYSSIVLLDPYWSSLVISLNVTTIPINTYQLLRHPNNGKRLISG